MRKASREMDAAFALEVLDKAPYVTVSFTRPNGTPYCVADAAEFLEEQFDQEDGLFKFEKRIML